MTTEYVSTLRGETASVLARRVYVDELPGWWGKTLQLQPGQQAVVVRDGQTAVLSPPRHRLTGPLGGGPDAAVVIETGSLTLHPAIGGLLSGDGQLLDADFLVRVQVADPRRLYQALGPNRERLTPGELAGLLAGEVRARLAAATRQYAAADLCTNRTLAEHLAGDLRSLLSQYLESLGLDLQQVSHLTFLRAEDALHRAEALRQLRDRLRQSDMKARLAALRDEKEYQEAFRELGDEYGLPDALSEEELGVGPAAETDGTPRSPAEVLAEVLDQKLASQQQQLVARFEELLRRLGYRDAAEEARKATIDGINRWVTVLRALGTIFILSTTLINIFWPGFFTDTTLPQVVTSIAGIVLSALAFASAFWLHDQQRSRRAVERAAREQARIGPERRQAAERMVRARLSGSLQRVESNLEQAWTRAYRSSQDEVFKPLRALAHGARRLRDEVQAASYEASRLLTGKELAPADLQALLELDEGLLEQGDSLAESSQAVHDQVVGGQLDQVDDRAKKLETGLQDLRNRLIKRSALLKGV